MKTATTRKLEETSWLAQTLSDKMKAEFDNNGVTARYNSLSTLYTIVREADKTENESIRYENENNTRKIYINNIPSLAIEYGLDYSQENMINRLRGIAERYTDDNGSYIVNVKTTHDLNSAVVEDISELLYQMAH